MKQEKEAAARREEEERQKREVVWACLYGGHACMVGMLVWWACLYGHACMGIPKQSSMSEMIYNIPKELWGKHPNCPRNVTIAIFFEANVV